VKLTMIATTTDLKLVAVGQAVSRAVKLIEESTSHMTAKSYTDIFCDGEDCFEWESGCNSTRKTVARKRVAREGWTTRRVQRRLYDLCPKCTARSATPTDDRKPTSKGFR